jgi:hypothetical protein
MLVLMGVSREPLSLRPRVGIGLPVTRLRLSHQESSRTQPEKNNASFFIMSALFHLVEWLMVMQCN